MDRFFYRIHTEYRANLEQLITNSRLFSGFTIVRGRGYWQGVGEESACIEIIDEPDRESDVLALADYIKHVNKQEAVHVTCTPVVLKVI